MVIVPIFSRLAIQSPALVTRKSGAEIGYPAKTSLAKNRCLKASA